MSLFEGKILMITGGTDSFGTAPNGNDLVTVMWANERFDPNKPDTFFEKVEE